MNKVIMNLRGNRWRDIARPLACQAEKDAEFAPLFDYFLENAKRVAVNRVGLRDVISKQIMSFVYNQRADFN